MRQLRGTCEATLYKFGIHIRRLLDRLRDEPGRFDAVKLRQFVMEAHNYPSGTEFQLSEVHASMSGRNLPPLILPD